MNWALGIHDPNNLINDQMEKAQELIQTNDGPFKQALDRYKYPNRFEGEDCSKARDNCESVFQDLDQILARGQHLLGDQVSFTDLAIFPFIRQCANVDRSWFDSLPIPNLQRWLEYHLNSDLFVQIMSKYPIWQTNTEGIIFEQQSNL